MKQLLSLILCTLAVFPSLAQETQDLVERTFPFLKRAVVPEKFGSGKKYAFIAVYDNQIFAVKDELNDKKRFVAENVTAAPTLMDENNYFELNGENSSAKFAVKGANGYYVSSGTSENSSFKQTDGVTGARVWITKEDKEDNTLHELWLDSRFLGYDYFTGKDNFALYSSSSTNYPAARLYEYDESVKPLGVMNIGTDEGYGTLYTNVSYVMPQGVTGCTVTEADAEAGDLTINDTFAPGTTVPAGTALLLKGVKGAYPYYAPAATTETPALNLDGNLLLGLSEEGNTVPPAGVTDATDYLYYKLYYLTEADGSNRRLGFFWGAEEGAAFTVPAGKAYLALKRTQAYNIKGFVLPDVKPTSVPALTLPATSAPVPAPVYTITGQRLPEGTSLPKGVYIRAGRKFVVK